MPKSKSGVRRNNINFRQTKSERSATQSYQNFGAFIKQKVSKIIIKNK